MTSCFYESRHRESDIDLQGGSRENNSLTSKDFRSRGPTSFAPRLAASDS